MNYKDFFDIKSEYEKRKKNNKLLTYNTGRKIHKKQLEFHKDTSRIRWVFGGNRTGKTVCGAVEAVWYARGNHPYKKITKPTRGWIVSLTSEVQRDVAQREILKWLNPEWIVKVIVRKGEKADIENAVIDYIIVKSVWGGNSVIGFKNCEQGRTKFQGTSQDYIWFDEEPPRDIFFECKMRVVDTCGDIWGTMTPLMGLTWVYDEIYLKSGNGIKCWMMEWADNPYLSEEEIKSLCENMSDEERESRQYGRFLTANGIVYKEFDENVHVIDPFDVPKEWYDNISIDPGLKAPLSCHFYAEDNDGTVYVIAEHYVAGKPLSYHCERILDIAEKLDWPKNRNGYISALIDSAANQTTLAGEKSVTQLFRENGIYAIPLVDKSKWAGIQRVKSYLKIRHDDDERYPNGKPNIFIFKTCPNLIREIKSYRWKAEGDEPIKKDDHALDELRYYIMNKKEKLKSDNYIDKYISKKQKGLYRKKGKLT